MRAWLLFLAVLATFLTIVQVASTEDISVRFLTAIGEQNSSRNRTLTETTSSSSTSSSLTTAITTIPKAKSTALTKAFNPIYDLTLTARKRTTSTSTATENVKASKFRNKSSDKNSENSEKGRRKVNEKIGDKKKKSEKNTSEISPFYSKQLQIFNEVTKVKQHLSSIDQLDSFNNKLDYKHKNHKKPNFEVQHNQVVLNKTEPEPEMQQQEHKQQQQHQKQQQEMELISLELTANSSTESHLHMQTFSAQDISADSDSVEILASVEVPANVNAVIAEDGPATYSNKEIIQDKVKPDPSTLVEIENSLLSLFNMKRPPKIDRSKIIIPEAMKQLYAQIMGHELDSVNIPRPGLLTKSANTVRSFTHKDSKIDDRFPHHHRFRLHFDVKSIPNEEKLKAAELQLTRDTISHTTLHPRQANRTRYQVLVYDITRVGMRGKREPNYLLLDSKTVHLNSTETLSLDVQPAVDRWLATPNKNYGLLVEVRTMRSLKPAPHHHVRLRRSAAESQDKWQHKQPLLFTYTDDGRHKARSIRDVSSRSKRAGGGHHRRPPRRKFNDEICRRHSLYVDFADVGWSDWIVAPPGYDAFYCHGKCPFPLADHLNSTNHAVVQTLVNNINPGKVPKACCVPTQLEGISMLYLNDQSTVVLKNYQDMTVVGCGCR